MKTSKSSSIRNSAITAITLATAAITSCLLAFPIFLIQVQIFGGAMQDQIELCKMRSEDVWNELHKRNEGVFFRSTRDASLLHNDGQKSAEPTKPKPINDWMERNETTNRIANRAIARMHRERMKRQEDGCCTCNLGPPGSQGEPGFDGADGIDGIAGEIGPIGLQASPRAESMARFTEQCPCDSPPGPLGLPGQPGLPGNPGDQGQRGNDGALGLPGRMGQQGPPGEDGRVGTKGLPGRPGSEKQGDKSPPGNQGYPGTPGKQGLQGPPGSPGDTGKTGHDGNKGPPGQPGKQGWPGQMGEIGPQGNDGKSGTCDHCPPPRLSSGY